MDTHHVLWRRKFYKVPKKANININIWQKGKKL